MSLGFEITVNFTRSVHDCTKRATGVMIKIDHGGISLIDSSRKIVVKGVNNKI
jgi:hypothetical protein